MSRQDRQPSERGIVLVIVALAMTVVLLVVALVIDFGNVRNSRQENKLIADVSATAGLQALGAEGFLQPWRGVCAALTYLEANANGTALTVSYFDGNETPVSGDPCVSSTTQECVPNTPSTWAWIRATDGTFTADIRSGYLTPDPDFPEDAAVYGGDDDASAQGGCDQLAVIINDGDPAFFGGVAGAEGYDTVSRSVGRLEIGRTGEVAVALVLLEQEDCRTLNFQGGAGGTGRITVRGTDNRPGIIHADSSGTSDCSSGEVVVVGKNNSGRPLVQALSAPSDPSIHGVISTYARSLGNTNDANWSSTRSASDVWACDPDHPTGDGTPVLTCDTGPTGNSQVTRTPADDRYLDDVTALRTEANTVFNGITGSATPSGYTSYLSLGLDDCALEGGGSSPPPVIVTSAMVPSGKLYVDCDVLEIRNGHLLTIEAGITDVVFQGRITFAGSGTLDVRQPERVLVHNRTGVSPAINVTADADFRVNLDGFADCDARHAAEPDRTTEMVLRTGGLTVQGGGDLHLCGTFLHLMGGDNPPAPVNTASSSYPAPYENTQDGTFDIAGGGTVEWTASNTEAGPPTSGAYPFEDLAVWTEASANNFLRGGGGMTLAGVFFLPNTGPESGPGGLTITGSSGGAINFDAQLWARKLSHEGGANFIMRSNPADSIQLPFLAGTALVR